mgnify:FL=1
MFSFRIGSGYDVHRLAVGRPLVLCGVHIPAEYGEEAHSDGDVALHALCDAMLGALALGDIGHFFPDTDPRYKNIDSRILLRETYSRVVELGWQIANTDLTILLQAPKLAPYINAMRNTLATDLNLDIAQVSIKATTTERLGFVGRGDGIAAEAVVLLQNTQ